MRSSLIPFVLLALLIQLPLGAADQPNIVWLTSEDNSRDWLRLYHKSGAPMPQLERLAANSLVFNHAYSNAPVCSVARTSLITGCYAPKLGAQLHRSSKLSRTPLGMKLFPSYLREAGYFTSNNSKEDYNVVGSQEWDESSNSASYRHRAPGQPFFHIQNFMATHESTLHFDAVEMKRQSTQTDPAEVQLLPYHPDTPTFRYTYAHYLDQHRELDRQLGDFLDQLEADDLREDTIIFYFGDNGGTLPRSKGFIYDNGVHVPLVIHVPTKWRHLLPVEAVGRTDAFVSFIDFAPSVLQLAGLTPPSQMDGKPFFGASVSRAEFEGRDEVFMHADRFDEKYDLVRSVRQGRFKYTRHFQPYYFDGLQNNYRYKSLAYREWRERYRTGNLNAIQRQFFDPHPAETLFDLATDPHEIHNLASDSAYATKLTELRQRLTTIMRELPDLGFFPENYLVDEGLADPEAFGPDQQQRIRTLITTADLILLPFEEAEPKIARALASSDPWVRYWALNTCTAFGLQAKGFAADAESIATSDPEVVNRMRAAEFLGSTHLANPVPLLRSALRHSHRETEAALILNSIVFLQDGAGIPFDLTRNWLRAEWLKDPKSPVSQRLIYLASNEAIPR